MAKPTVREGEFLVFRFGDGGALNLGPVLGLAIAKRYENTERPRKMGYQGPVQLLITALIGQVGY